MTETNQRENPFLAWEPADPYALNPFRILKAKPDATAGKLEGYARDSEKLVAKGIQPIDGVELRPGVPNKALTMLKDPVLRLVFELMLDDPEE